MAEEKTNQEKKEKNGIIVKFTKPYVFENEEYTEVDMTGLQNLTIQDAINAQAAIFSEHEDTSMSLCEMGTAFAREIAAKASGLPIEFFKLMPIRESRKVKQTVQNFMDVEDLTENNVVHLHEPYTFTKSDKTQQTYTEIDLSGIADLNSMNESEAENRLLRAGFLPVNMQFNTLYACVIASMGTGLPQEFFTGLPIKETMIIKNAATDKSFFE